MDFLKLVKDKMNLLKMDQSFMNRAVNEGFSGGEKKRNEIFQMAVINPRLALMDETDSGLDIDALKVVAQGANSLREPDKAILIVTHYQRLLNYIEPFCTCDARRTDRQDGRQGIGAGTGIQGLRLD